MCLPKCAFATINWYVNRSRPAMPVPMSDQQTVERSAGGTSSRADASVDTPP